MLLLLLTVKYFHVEKIITGHIFAETLLQGYHKMQLDGCARSPRSQSPLAGGRDQ